MAEQLAQAMQSRIQRIGGGVSFLVRPECVDGGFGAGFAPLRDQELEQGQWALRRLTSKLQRCIVDQYFEAIEREYLDRSWPEVTCVGRSRNIQATDDADDIWDFKAPIEGCAIKDLQEAGRGPREHDNKIIGLAQFEAKSQSLTRGIALARAQQYARRDHQAGVLESAKLRYAAIGSDLLRHLEGACGIAVLQQGIGHTGPGLCGQQGGSTGYGLFHAGSPEFDRRACITFRQRDEASRDVIVGRIEHACGIEHRAHFCDMLFGARRIARIESSHGEMVVHQNGDYQDAMGFQLRIANFQSAKCTVEFANLVQLPCLEKLPQRELQRRKFRVDQAGFNRGNQLAAQLVIATREADPAGVIRHPYKLHGVAGLLDAFNCASVRPIDEFHMFFHHEQHAKQRFE